MTEAKLPAAKSITVPEGWNGPDPKLVQNYHRRISTAKQKLDDARMAYANEVKAAREAGIDPAPLFRVQRALRQDISKSHDERKTYDYYAACLGLQEQLEMFGEQLAQAAETGPTAPEVPPDFE